MKITVNSLFSASYKSIFALLLTFGLGLGNVNASETGHASESVAAAHDSLGAEAHADEHVKEGFNAGDMIMHHVTDSYDWHIMDFGGHAISIPLPVIVKSEGQGWEVFSTSRFEHGHASYNGYTLDHGHLLREDGAEFWDLSITKNTAAMMLSMIIICILFISVANAYKKRTGLAPKGLQSFIEPLILFVRDDIAKSSIGPKYERYMPFLLSVFFFIWINNLLGLVPFFPGGVNVTGSVAVCLVLALFTFAITIFSGNKSYWMHIVNTPGVPWWLKFPVPLMPIVEILGFFSKPFVLMVRLFANITAGHIIVLGFFSLIFIFGDMSAGAGLGVSVFSLIFTIFMTILELLVAFLQAYVFTLLSAIYFGMAIEEHHHDHAHNDHDHGKHESDPHVI